MKQQHGMEKQSMAALKYGPVMYEPVKHRAVKYKAAQHEKSAACSSEEWASDV